ncbi:MAG: TonB-dependent receptor [Myxococcales bacterium]|nr:MAG: TonB-dependent receptor [Myxococcales bacterium]
MDETVQADEEVEGGGKDESVVERQGRVNFKGRVLERGTRKPIADATLYLKNTEEQAATDRRGRFSFTDLPPGAYEIVIAIVNYDKFETSETLTEGELLEVTYYMEPRVYGTLEVVVRGKKEQKEVSRKVLPIEEAKVIPGSQGDAVKVVQNLPGVARGGTSSAGIVIRGSNAEDSRTVLDGHRIPILFHFGGYKSVYNADLLSEINLYTGGFGTEWGDATGGVVELKTRRPRLDRWGGYVDTSLIDATALVEGPITDDMGFAFAFRRSIADLILPLFIEQLVDPDELSFTTLPVYYDYQMKWDYQINKENYIAIDWYGAMDKLELLSNLVSDTEPDFTGEIGFRTMFHNLALRHRYKSGAVESNFSPAFAFTELKAFFGKQYFFTLRGYTGEIYEDVSLTINEHNTLGFGLQLEPSYGAVESNLIRPPKEGAVGFSFANEEKVTSDVGAGDLKFGIYLNDEIRYGKWLVIPGVRFDYDTTIAQYAISPRGIVRYQVIEPVTLKLAGGLFQRVPDPDEVYRPYGNPNLGFERAAHIVGGVEWNILDYLTLDVQGYYKYLDNLVTAKQEDDGSGDIYENGGKGYVVGGEFLLRHNFANNFFGWISYSISRSMRNDGPGTSYRPFDMDQTHNLIVVASYKLLKTWQIGGRFQLTTGEPYTNIKGGIYNADNGTYLPIYDAENKGTERMGLYHQLDIRIDKAWVFNTWILYTYLDVQNVYYHANPIAVNWNYNYTENTEMKMIPILPSIGIKAEF